MAYATVPTDAEDCSHCDGTGEGRTEYQRCPTCRGRGWLVPQGDDDEPTDNQIEGYTR